MNTLHTNTLSTYILIYTTSQNLSRPPIQTIPTNPLSNCLTSTNPNHSQQSTTCNTRNNHTNIKSLSTLQYTNQTIQYTVQDSHYQTFSNI